MMDRPWMTALEMQVAAMKAVALATTSADQRMKWAPAQRMLTKAATLVDAVPYAWTEDTIRAVKQAGATIPSDASLDTADVPEVCWWWFDTPIDSPAKYIELAGLSPEEADTRAVLFYRALADDGSTGVAVLTFGLMKLDDGHLVPIVLSQWAWREGETLQWLRDNLGKGYFNRGDKSEHADGTPQSFVSHVEEVSRFLLAALVWLRQSVIIALRARVERHQRKQFLREQGFEISDVKVIQLRRAESQPHEPAGTGDPVEWSCRWIVNGHWRNQFHPSTGKHELKYILPYVKGPADKPLKVPTQTVYAVNR